MSTDFNETPGTPRYRRPAGKGSLGQMWQNPIFKLVVIVIVLAGAAMAGVKILSGRRSQHDTTIPAPVQSGIQDNANKEEVSQDYVLAVQEGDAARAAAARATGESNVPTPLQVGVTNPEAANDLSSQDGQDPLKAFEAILQTNGADGAKRPPLPQGAATTRPQVPAEVLNGLTQSMSDQINMLIRAWTPEGMQTVSSSINESQIMQRSANNSSQLQGGVKPAGWGGEIKPIVTAGSVYYGQMLVEANSDVPGPIMAQILTGPLAGGKAIGKFETFRNHLVISFDTVAFRTKQMEVSILVLDPNTTLGGIATEVNPRYLQRVLLPAAAAFVSAYGETLSRPTSTVSVTGTGNSNITTNTNKQDSKDAMYAGIGESANRVSQFLDEEAAATKRLVRVAVGTPVGLFFTRPVCGMAGQCEVEAERRASASSSTALAAPVGGGASSVTPPAATSP